MDQTSKIVYMKFLLIWNVCKPTTLTWLQFDRCFVWSTDPLSPTRARIPTTTAEKWLSVKRVPCPLRPQDIWDRKRRQSWRSTKSLGTVIPPRRRNPFALSSAARRFWLSPTPAPVKLATLRCVSSTDSLLIMLAAEEFQLLPPLLLMVDGRIDFWLL